MRGRDGPAQVNGWRRREGKEDMGVRKGLVMEWVKVACGGRKGERREGESERIRGRKGGGNTITKEG